MTRLVPPKATVRHLDTGGGRVRVLSAGDPASPPVLLVHGGATDNAAISWYRLFEPLSHTHRVLAADLPGFGDTTGIEPLDGPRAQADFLARLLDRLGVQRAVVCGVSMGGDIALNLGLHHPEAVRGLALIAPGGLSPLLHNRLAHTAAWLSARLPEPVMLPVAALANRFVGTMLKAVVQDVSTLPEPVIEEFKREARRPRASLGYLRYNRATLGRTGMLNYLMPEVSGIQAPTLFFHGRNDPLVPLQGSREAAARMPNARLVAVSDCGHWAQLEAHERFMAEMATFLGQVRP